MAAPSKRTFTVAGKDYLLDFLTLPSPPATTKPPVTSNPNL